MAKCDSANDDSIRRGDQREATVLQHKMSSAGMLLAASRQIPDATVLQKVMEVRQGLCPVCSHRGTIDVHMTYAVYSMLVMTGGRTSRSFAADPARPNGN